MSNTDTLVTVTNVPRAAMLFSLDREAVTRVIRELAQALATEDTVDMEAYIETATDGTQRLRLGRRGYMPAAHADLHHIAADVPEA